MIKVVGALIAGFLVVPYLLLQLIRYLVKKVAADYEKRIKGLEEEVKRLDNKIDEQDVDAEKDRALIREKIDLVMERTITRHEFDQLNLNIQDLKQTLRDHARRMDNLFQK